MSSTRCLPAQRGRPSAGWGVRVDLHTFDLLGLAVVSLGCWAISVQPCASGGLVLL
ncbi:hypothetical protein [Nocardia amikacinitolerans]|uniref:hypothetical protein n=1 Tax=Nocardia amikacinitolerans TaxID=756689 RepID=UPI0020A53C87|nr:hypothetical protein [Nocardia amikacinitolerans]